MLGLSMYPEEGSKGGTDQREEQAGKEPAHDLRIDMVSAGLPVVIHPQSAEQSTNSADNKCQVGKAEIKAVHFTAYLPEFIKARLGGNIRGNQHSGAACSQETYYFHGGSIRDGFGQINDVALSQGYQLFDAHPAGGLQWAGGNQGVAFGSFRQAGLRCHFDSCCLLWWRWGVKDQFVFTAGCCWCTALDKQVKQYVQRIINAVSGNDAGQELCPVHRSRVLMCSLMYRVSSGWFLRKICKL